MTVTITSAGIDYRDDSQDRYKGVSELHNPSYQCTNDRLTGGKTLIQAWLVDRV
jgi:hypothetical protein